MIAPPPPIAGLPPRPTKPPHGEQCNRCGQCCRDAVCWLGEIVLGDVKAPCPALIDGRECGLMVHPENYRPEQANAVGAEAMRRAARMLLTADTGCDLKSLNESANPHFRPGELRFTTKETVKALQTWGITRRESIDYRVGLLARGHCEHGRLLADQDKCDSALAAYNKSISVAPNYVEAYRNRGVLLRNMMRLRESMASYDRAIALRPTDAKSHWYRGLDRLLKGDYASGWTEFEWRHKVVWKSSEGPGRLAVTRFAQPRWNGEELHGRTLLLCSEQGFGDIIQFIRFAAELAPFNGRVVLWTSKALVNLMETATGVDAVVPMDGDVPCSDVYFPLLSLPHVLKITLDNLPTRVPYLHADPMRSASWRRRLSALDGLRVGLVWAGSPSLQLDRRRSLTLWHFAELADIPGVTFVSLQKGSAAAETSQPPAGLLIHDWTGELDDFAETAALIDGLDLVIAVDTAVAHLAGALGKPVWLLNRFDTCWRWLLDRPDSPWYPTMRIFRQPKLGDWGSVFAGVHAALTSHLVASEPI
jgi:tetratricopeptide (TPR) repeat protein